MSEAPVTKGHPGTIESARPIGIVACYDSKNTRRLRALISLRRSSMYIKINFMCNEHRTLLHAFMHKTKPRGEGGDTANATPTSHSEPRVHPTRTVGVQQFGTIAPPGRRPSWPRHNKRAKPTKSHEKTDSRDRLSKQHRRHNNCNNSQSGQAG